MFNCAQGFSCPPPTLPTLDPFNPFQSRWIDVSAGGPNTFSWNVTSDVSFAKVSPSSGTISTSKKEQRLEVSVDWSKVSNSTATATLTFTAVAKGQQTESQQIILNVAKTSVPSSFKGVLEISVLFGLALTLKTGFVEGDGTVTFEAAHATRNIAVNGVQWSEIPNYGRTLSGMTPLPALGNNDNNFTVGAGPKLSARRYSHTYYSFLTTL